MKKVSEEVNDYIEEEELYDICAQNITGNASIKALSEAYGYTKDQIESMTQFVKTTCCNEYLIAVSDFKQGRPMSELVDISKRIVSKLCEKYMMSSEKIVEVVTEKMCDVVREHKYPERSTNNVAFLSTILDLSAEY